MITRRYDIDWIRVIAILLLLIYHTAIGFQPWGIFIGFITNNPSWEALWPAMTMLNVWRIPLLFYVSGMGVFLAMQNRNWKQLFSERFFRIGIPLLFGAIFIVPLHILLIQKYYHQQLSYIPNLGHLWFLGNILIYVAVLSPLFYFLKKTEQKNAGLIIKKWMNTPLMFVLVVTVMALEAVMLNPAPFELYAFTNHGFLLGLLAFFFGFCMMYTGKPIWDILGKWRYIFLLIAGILFFMRLYQIYNPHPVYLLSVESNCWIFSLVGFAYKYFNKPSNALHYLKEAVYPVYIIHMAFLYLGSIILFHLKMEVSIKFILLLSFTLIGSLCFYEFIVRPFNLIRFFFGLKKK